MNIDALLLAHEQEGVKNKQVNKCYLLTITVVGVSSPPPLPPVLLLLDVAIPVSSGNYSMICLSRSENALAEKSWATRLIIFSLK